MRNYVLSVWLVLAAAALLGCAAGCGHGLKWQVVGPVGGPCRVGPFQIEVSPVDTTRLKRDHPFRYQGTKLAAFMLFDVKIVNTGDKDLYCNIGHRDFPEGPVAVLTAASPSESRTSERSAEGPPLLGPADFRAEWPELPSILMPDGCRCRVLGYEDFNERYYYLMLRGKGQAGAIQVAGYTPYTFGIPRLVSGIARHRAEKHMPERLMEAQRQVLRTGVVPAGAMVRGFLVFPWPDVQEPTPLTLRLPVQPGHTASMQFEIVRRE